MTCHYTPGAALLFRRGDVACFLGDDVDAVLIAEIWSALDCAPDEDPLEDVLEVLTRSYGLRNMPPFVLLEQLEGGVRCIRRGAIVTGDADVDLPAPPGSAPWSAEIIESARLRVGAQSPSPWPLDSGVVRADGLMLTSEDQPQADPPPGDIPVPVTAVPPPVAAAPSDVDEPSGSRVGTDRLEADPEDDEDLASGYTTLLQRHRDAGTSAPEAATAPGEAPTGATVTPPVADPRSAPPVAPVLHEAHVSPGPVAAHPTQTWNEADLDYSGSSVGRETQVPTPPSPGVEGIIDGIPDFSAPTRTPPPGQTQAPPSVPVPVPVPVPTPDATPPPRRPSVPPPRTAVAPAPPAPPASADQYPRPRSAPDVRAVACPSGHWNPAAAAACRVCGLQISPQEAVWMPRPALGKLRLPGGEVLDLDRGAVFGRAPRPPSSDGQRPHLINISSYGPHLSRMHLEIVLDDWFVLVRDLGSSEGTTVILPGLPPERLRAHELVNLVSGSTVDLAGDYVFTFEAGS